MEQCSQQVSPGGLSPCACRQHAWEMQKSGSKSAQPSSPVSQEAGCRNVYAAPSSLLSGNSSHISARSFQCVSNMVGSEYILCLAVLDWTLLLIMTAHYVSSLPGVLAGISLSPCNQPNITSLCVCVCVCGQGPPTVPVSSVLLAPSPPHCPSAGAPQSALPSPPHRSHGTFPGDAPSFPQHQHRTIFAVHPEYINTNALAQSQGEKWMQKYIFVNGKIILQKSTLKLVFL